MAEAETDDPALSDETLEVLKRRYGEARDAGLTMIEAQLFQTGDTDIGVLRKLVRDGCPVALIREIVL